MESVHKPQMRSWIQDSITNVKEFCEHMSQVLPDDIPNLECDDTIIQNLVSEKELSDLEKQCRFDALKSEYHDRVELSNSINLPADINFDTLKYQKEDLMKRRGSTKYTFLMYSLHRHANFPPHQSLGPFDDIDNIPSCHVETPEVILSVQIFVPERRTENAHLLPHVTKVPAFQVDQEFLVLGNQYLTELRDKIECVSDTAIPGEYSECPTAKPHSTCKDLYKSGFFYINGTFYNDMRDPDCRDYSSIIMNWAAKEKSGIGPFRKAEMEKTKFIDLSIKMGYPYVYIHQGECEHLLVFSDLRMLRKPEIKNKNAYPLFVMVKPSRRVFCMLCHAYTSSWVVCDNSRLTENPFFFCKYCFYSFNYDQNNQKIGSFRAYHFPDRSKLT